MDWIWEIVESIVHGILAWPVYWFYMFIYVLRNPLSPDTALFVLVTYGAYKLITRIIRTTVKEWKFIQVELRFFFSDAVENLRTKFGSKLLLLIVLLIIFGAPVYTKYSIIAGLLAWPGSLLWGFIMGLVAKLSARLDHEKRFLTPLEVTTEYGLKYGSIMTMLIYSTYLWELVISYLVAMMIAAVLLLNGLTLAGIFIISMTNISLYFIYRFRVKHKYTIHQFITKIEDTLDTRKLELLERLKSLKKTKTPAPDEI